MCESNTFMCLSHSYPIPCYFPCVCVCPCHPSSCGFALLALAGPGLTSPSITVSRPTLGPLLSPQSLTLPAEALSLLPRLHIRPVARGHSVMVGSVGGRRPEETHMLKDAHNADTRTHTCTQKDQQGLSPTSCSEREGGGNRKGEGSPNRHN